MEIPVYQYRESPISQVRAPSLPQLPEDFGQAVPQALERLGATLRTVGERSREAQQHMAARAALAQDHLDVEQLLEEVRRQPNYEAAVEMTQQGLQRFRQRGLQGLTDPDSQRVYDAGFLRLAQEAGLKALHIRAKGRVDDALASREAGVTAWTDTLSRADTPEAQAAAMAKLIGLIRDGVAGGITTRLQAQKDAEGALERAAHAHALRRRLVDPDATAEAVDKGQGIYQFIRPEMRERTVTYLINQTEKDRRAAQADGDREAKRIIEATEIELLRAFDYPAPGTDPDTVGDSILKQAYAAFDRGLLNREAVERVRAKVTSPARAQQGNPQVYADFMSNAIRGTGKYAPRDVADAQARGDLTPAEMHGIIGAMERRGQAEADRSVRRAQTQEERAARAEERKVEEDTRQAAKLLQRQIGRAAKQRGIVDQNQLNLIQDLAEQEVYNLRRQGKLSMEQVPVIADKYIPLMGGLTSQNLRSRLDPRFGSMLELETRWRAAGLEAWEYERERELWMLYDRQIEIEEDVAAQKAYREKEKAYREQSWFRRWSTTAPTKPTPKAPAPLPPRSGGSPVGTAVP